MTGQQPRRFKPPWSTGPAPAPPASTGVFGVLGLDPGSEVSDDDVRAAWRRIAAATHPDRPDGGDPARFAAAAAAYTDLRTAASRREARAALAESRAGRRSGSPHRRLVRVARPPDRSSPRFAPPHPGRPAPTSAQRRPGRLAPTSAQRRLGWLALTFVRGRPGRVVLRFAVAATAAVASVLAVPGPAGPGLAAGAATWFVVTAYHDVWGAR